MLTLVGTAVDRTCGDARSTHCPGSAKFVKTKARRMLDAWILDMVANLGSSSLHSFRTTDTEVFTGMSLHNCMGFVRHGHDVVSWPPNRGRVNTKKYWLLTQKICCRQETVPSFELDPAAKNSAKPSSAQECSNSWNM
jgi:hypothetical protein